MRRQKATAPGQHLTHKAEVSPQEKRTMVPTLSSSAAQRFGSEEEAGVITESFIVFPKVTDFI